MTAYVDTSCLIALAFDEPSGRAVARRLDGCERLVSSNLLEAELRATFAREDREANPAEYLAGISWVLPNRPLTVELGRVLTAGVLRGADLWHLACALLLDPECHEVLFLTLDKAQARAAARLGFRGMAG
jgi:predicted nucleic acid-binding protein